MNTPTDSKAYWIESSDGKRVPLHGHVSLGRSRTNTIPILCDKASRRHALIHQNEDGECLVIDLGSSNGTYVNGTRVTHLTNLRGGDVVEIGDERFTLRERISGVRSEKMNGEEATAAGAEMVPCWIIVGDKENPDAPIRREDIEDSYKTTVSWTQACRHIAERNKGAIPSDFEGKLFAYWRDPSREEAVAECVAQAVRELQSLQSRNRMEFRFAVHFGTVVIGASGPRQKKALIGTEVTFAFQIQRLAWELATPCLFSEEANRGISPLLTTFPIEQGSACDYRGDRRLFVV